MGLVCSGEPVDSDPRKHLNTRQWETGMCEAFCANPCACFLGCLFPCPCAVYLRCKALQNDMTKYKCCQGYVCWDCVSCLPTECVPECWLCCEAALCVGCSISATRIYVQEERQIQTDPCDNRIIRFNNFMQILRCVCDILAIFFGELQFVAHIIDIIAQLVWLFTIGSMIAQVYVELSRHPTAANY
jgi:hypothetical protein